MITVKTLLSALVVVSVLPSAHANQVSKSQQKFIAKYEKQKNIPDPAAMLINTDPEPELTQGFTPLFNGTDLEGWKPLGGHCTYEVTDGEIVGTCVPGSPSTYLSSIKDDYANFVFSAELKWAVNGNSGVMFRAQPKGDSVKGPQAEMEGPGNDRSWSGGIYGQGCGGWYYPLWLEAHKEARKALKDGEWNRITIQAEGDTVKTWINGIPAAHWKNDEYTQGFFSLQVHSGKQGEIHFRNIKVKEL